jgi:stearoyl-CoA desaturase (delta-9 desaturase)
MLFWLFVAIGNGTIGHRYFSHNQFKVGNFKHWIFAFWCTISAYSNTSYWQVQHRHHHRNSDTDADIHSPRLGFWQSIFIWPFNKKRIESIFNDRHSKINLARSYQDKSIKFTSENFILINLSFLIFLGFVNYELIPYYFAAFILDSLRLGIINSVLHIPGFPGNYRNHETKDNSQNNLIIGLLTLGFGWHNNHHNNPSKLILTEKWWELDIEGLIGKILSKEIFNERRNS